MNVEEFLKKLEAKTDGLKLVFTKDSADPTDIAYTVYNERFETTTIFTGSGVGKNEWNHIVLLTHQGRNVEHITRVTGYFSKVSGWNKGKVAELKDRVRTTVQRGLFLDQMR